MSKIIVANWKMNGSLALTDIFLESIIKSEELILALPHVLIGYAISKNKKLKIAAQDCSVFTGYGAHTGEISAQMLSDLGVKHVIIGHSERRSTNAETIDIIYKKIKSALGSGLNVILCIDENYSKLIDEKTNELLKNNSENIIIAYEPVSAIGTGIVPTINQISTAISEIKAVYYGIKTLYGGSVNSTNSMEILAIDQIDGVLVGGASLKINEIEQILLCA